jgi:hypothetical protein
MNPIERAEYILKQMRIYLNINKSKQNNEYDTIELIFQYMLNIIGEENINNINNLYFEINNKIKNNNGRSFYYWQELIKLIRYKIKLIKD